MNMILGTADHDTLMSETTDSSRHIGMHGRQPLQRDQTIPPLYSKYKMNIDLG